MKQCVQSCCMQHYKCRRCLCIRTWALCTWSRRTPELRFSYCRFAIRSTESIHSFIHKLLCFALVKFLKWLLECDHIWHIQDDVMRRARNKSYLSHLLHLVRYLTHDNHHYHQFDGDGEWAAATAKGKQNCITMPCRQMHAQYVCALLVLAKF